MLWTTDGPDRMPVPTTPAEIEALQRLHPEGFERLARAVLGEGYRGRIVRGPGPRIGWDQCARVGCSNPRHGNYAECIGHLCQPLTPEEERMQRTFEQLARERARELRTVGQLSNHSRKHGQHGSRRAYERQQQRRRRWMLALQIAGGAAIGVTLADIIRRLIGW